MEDDIKYVRMAFAEAYNSTCSSKHAVGALLVTTEGVTVADHNGAADILTHCDSGSAGKNCILDSNGRCIRALHAEERVIIRAARTGVSTQNATLYCTHAPCVSCASKILQAGIKRVVFCGTPTSSSGIEMLFDHIEVVQWRNNVR
jgi:dCMP deaminase